MARGISLHLGLNAVDPSHYNGWDGTLAACEFDAKDMHAIADTAGFTSSLLLTQEATSEAVTNAIKKAASELDSGDTFLLTCSSHGGQVPDTNNEGEEDHSDETWVLYDRQLIDDELFALWKDFKSGVRIFLLSDSCHSGSVSKAIDDSAVADAVSTAEKAAQQSPRYRALPRDTMINTYRGARRPLRRHSKRIAELARFRGRGGRDCCLDLRLPGRPAIAGRLQERPFHGGALRVWDNGAWKGDYPAFHKKILSGMPDDQQPNYFVVGAKNPEFEQQEPFTI